MEDKSSENHLGLQDEFITFKTLGTLAGAVATTWLVCNVLSSLLPADYLTYHQWRFVAFSVSEALSLYLTFRNKTKGADKWVLGFLNGLLIFVNVSGLNAISTGTKLFNGPDESRIQIKDSTSIKKANLLPNTKEQSWWPDIDLLNRIKGQAETIKQLQKRIKSSAGLSTKETSVTTGAKPSSTTPTTVSPGSTNDSVMAQ